MSPEGTGGTETGLHLVGNENGSVLLGNITETLEESRGGVVVTTLGLNGLNNETGNGAMPRGHDALNFFKASLLLGSVLLDVLLKRVLESREGGLGPVEARDIKLVDSLGAGGGEGAETTAVERVLETHDGELRRARLGVLKARVDLLLIPVSVAALAATVEHESSLVGKLVGLRSGLSSEDVAETLGGDLHEAVTEDIDPLVGRKVANRRTVDESGDHFGRLGSLDQSVVVVSDRDGSNLGVDIEVLVAININDVVIVRLVVVDNEVNGTGIENGIQTLGAGLGDRARNLRANGGLNEGRHCEACKDLWTKREFPLGILCLRERKVS